MTLRTPIGARAVVRPLAIAVIVVLAALLFALVGSAGRATAAAADCKFVLGFKALHAMIPDTVGTCVENEQHHPSNGVTLQRTNNGLLVWQKATNHTSFTDGYRTWVLGPLGLQQRLNTEQFDWERDLVVVPVSASDAPLVFDPLVIRGTLSNGLSYYIRHNEEPRDRAQISLVVRAGSVHEEENQRGLAHFVEHMAFNGTERFAKQEIVEYLESIGSTFGADLNAGTSFDYTRYWLEIPTDDPEITETAFQILSDWAYAVSFDPDEVELERGVVLEEWRLSQGFSSRLQDSLLQLLFGSSRYTDRAPIGLLEIIESAPVERLKEYYERWYRPALMAIVAVGDFDTEVIEAKVKQHFAPPPEGEASQARAAVAPATERPRFDVPGHDAPRIVVFTDPESPGTQFVLVRKLAPAVVQDVAAFRRKVVERLAFMMLNTRLFERGQAADPPYLQTASGRSPYVETLDIMTFSAWVEPGGVERGLAAVLEELQRVRQHGFTDTELAREKSNLLRSVESAYKQRGQTSSAGFVDEYFDHFLRGQPVPGIEAEWELYQQLLPQIALAEFEDLAASWTQLADTALLVVRAEATDSRSDDDLTAATLAQLQGASTLAVEPYAEDLDDVPLLATLPTPGTITAEERLESIDALKWTLSNGITVFAKQTDFKDDEVVFRSFSPGGHSLVTDEGPCVRHLRRAVGFRQWRRAA